MHSHPPDKSAPPEEAPGMGIMFTTVEPSLKTILGNFIDRLLDTEGGGGGDRLAPRVDTPPCRVQIHASKGEQGALLTNISRKGMFIQTKTPFNLFERIQTCITHPETFINLELEGEVIHVHKIADSPYGFGAGIQFLNLDAETQIAVIETVREIMFRQKISDRETPLPH